MSHRDRVRDFKNSGFVNEKAFRTSIRIRAEKDSCYYVVLSIYKKIKYYMETSPSQNPNDPKLTVSYKFIKKAVIDVQTIESNIPMPANVYNPIFKYRRDDPRTPLDPLKVSYAGLPGPEEYFTLPENVENTINRAEPVGDFFLTPGFIKRFDSMKAADEFISQMKEQIKIFLSELQSFVDSHKEDFDYEEVDVAGITGLDIKDGIVAKYYGLSSMIAPDIDNPKPEQKN